MGSTSAPPTSRFGSFIREHKQEILDTWKGRARATVTQAQRVAEAQLVDHVPFLLDRIAELSDQLDAYGYAEGYAPETREHARQRVFEGFDLRDVVSEYALLRECIVTLWESAEEQAIARGESTQPLHRALDHAVAESVDHYTLLRNRAHAALDSVSAAAFASSSVGDLLERLLRVFLECMPAVQTCAVLLREGDRLRVRAAVGLEEELTEGFSLAVGEGFAGTIAKTERPLLLRRAASDPLVKSPVIRKKGVKALYGVPIRHETKGVLGVAHMGSLTAEDFSREDQVLFESMVARAALAIEYHIAKQAAHDALTTRDEILAIVSHDLRTPLGAVNTAAEFLRRALPQDHRAERMRKAVGTIQRATARMSRLVDDLLDFGSIEAGQLRLEPRPEPAEELVTEAVDGHAAIAAENGLEIVSALGEALPPVLADRERVFQVFTNLIGNAVRLAPYGTTVSVGARVEGSFVRFSVSDEGPGIDDDAVAHVFDRYWRGYRESGKGRGLGLSIVKGIVEAHGGRVGVTSKRGAGSTFTFSLPIAP